MLASHQRQAAIELASSLAEEIAMAAPECALKAMQIVTILQDLNARPDQGTVQDIIEAETVDSDLSETSVRLTATAVVRALSD